MESAASFLLSQRQRLLERTKNILSTVDIFQAQTLKWIFLPETLMTRPPETFSNSLIECLLYATDSNYFMGIADGIGVDKKSVVQNVRKSLIEKVSSSAEASILQTSEYLGDEFLDLLSSHFNVNIYLLDYEKKTVLRALPDNRTTIILVKMNPSYYHLAYLTTPESNKFLFSAEDPFLTFF